MEGSRSTRAADVPTLAELRARRDDILRIASDHDAANVRVFGSVARGDARPDSDIDFLVELHTDKTGFAYFGLLQDLEDALKELLGRPVDVGTSVKSFARDSVERDLVPL
jgi:predicted nucleotidyltransferase